MERIFRDSGKTSGNLNNHLNNLPQKWLRMFNLPLNLVCLAQSQIDLDFLDKNPEASLNFMRTLSTKSSLWVTICWKDAIAWYCIIFGVTNLFLWDLRGDYNGLIRSYNFNICKELRYDLLQSSTPSNHFKDKETETQRFFSKFHSLYINPLLKSWCLTLFVYFIKWPVEEKKLLPISLNLVLIIFGIMIFFHKILCCKRIITSKPSKNEFT